MMLSIIIINYNTKKLLKDCLISIKKNKITFPYEIIVVDNASYDKSPAMIKNYFPEVKLIVNKNNLGFARAANQAILKSKGQYILLVNPDTIIPKNALVSMIKFMERHPEAAAATCHLLNPDGSIQYNVRTFPTLPAIFFRFSKLEKLYLPSFYRRYLMMDFDHKSIKKIDWAIGAFLMIRKKALENVGLFNERFFLYYEDVDWCYRARQKGWQIFYTPKPQIIHLYQRESAKGLININTLFHLKSIFIYFFERFREKFGYSGIKYSLDKILGILLLLICSPLFLLTALAIWLETRGSVLFKQERLGKNEKKFILYKFRTMSLDAEKMQKSLKKLNVADKILFKIPNDPRLTRVGRFLRTLGIDELPQLLNVIKGEMSLIGPRPMPIKDVDYKFINQNDFIKQFWKKRHHILPGITGYWQACAVDKLNFKEMLRHDAYYVDHLSFALDLKIAFYTIVTKLGESINRFLPPSKFS